MSAPRVLSQPLGGSALTQAALDGTLPDSWYASRPASPADWRTYLERVRLDFDGSDWLRALGPALPSDGAAAERLARCGDGRGVVVVTGQQPGLFGGPLYTWFKALSALAVADALQATTGVPVAPVFWAATDDADFLEASVTYVAVPGGIERLELPSPSRPAASLRDAPLEGIDALVATLERGAGAAVYPDVLRLVRGTYRAGATVGRAYVSLLRGVLGPLGVAVLDAGHPAVRRAARPVLVEALAASAAIERALEARAAELSERAFRPQVPLVRGLSLVFAVGGAERRRLAIGARPAAGAADGEPELGPNVLLRPVVERALLPSASYVAGPGEIAYFAQVTAVAATLRRPVQVVLPRWSGMVIEPHVERILERLGLRPDELRHPHAAEQRLARERLSGGVRGALEDGRAAVRSALDALGLALHADSHALVPDAVVAGVRRDVEHRLDRLERRIVAGVKRRHAEMMRDIATAAAALYPRGKPQERVLNAIPLLARHGPPLVDALVAAAAEHAAALSGRSVDGTLRHARSADSPPPERPTESAID